MDTFDTIVIGAGPSGLSFCASNKIRGRVLLIEAGKPLAERDSAQPNDIGVGVAGAGAYIDGKLSFFPAGTALWRGSYELLNASYAELRALLAPHCKHVPRMPSEQEVRDYLFACDAAWKLKRYPSLYMDETKRFDFLDALILAATAHAELRCHTRATRIIPADRGFIVKLKDDCTTEHIRASRVILAGGRFMPLQRLLRELPTPHAERFRRHEFGIRLELPHTNRAVQSMGNCGVLDPKFVLQSSESIHFRTFCFCKRGLVCKSVIDGKETYSGRADVAPTAWTNFGLMARTTDPSAFGEHEVAQFLERAFELDFANVKHVRRTAKRKLKRLCGESIGALIWHALAQLFDAFPALCCQELRLYGPCLEGVGSYPNVNARMQVHGSDNLYAIGDTNGTFRGLVPSLLSGFYLAHSL